MINSEAHKVIVIRQEIKIIIIIIIVIKKKKRMQLKIINSYVAVIVIL